MNGGKESPSIADTNLDDELQALDVSLLRIDKLKDTLLPFPLPIWQSLERRWVDHTRPRLQFKRIVVRIWPLRFFRCGGTLRLTEPIVGVEDRLSSSCCAALWTGPLIDNLGRSSTELTVPLRPIREIKLLAVE